ncbi:sporulation protein [Sphingopyxis terrae subsp. terrae NBRC 15098]|uniref:Sporulation protein n=1 Tax=Sphingopyxis terrae subsp. terrae NBRC 15098 TaxID=1219058 RepID=A0A142VUF7_9SPHN|nr:MULTISPECIES: SPOR domain-containing protein [Sphingopyxis]AMU93352.1 sporulation protein [Sphingopyxis terrae subsp. terrae NBRC 15098]
MRRSILTAGPRRVRLHVGALGLLFLSAAPFAAAHAFQVTPPDAATKAAMEKRTAARTMLSSAIARLASNAADSAALLDAGRASIELEDYRAALGFLTRAEQASPRDGGVKAALGSAMLHLEKPSRALDYFGEAQLLGAPERLFLADRGLARDLLGQQDGAQRDYQLALSIAPSDEVIRRYAISLGITGQADRAIQLLTPQLRTQDRAAWRSRAMILAINGRNDEATEIVKATMPALLAQSILPYLTQMDRLNPAQQAAAAHFGRFPAGELGPVRKPVQIAAAAPAPTPAPSPTSTPSKRRGDKGKPVQVATATPPPATRPAPTLTPKPTPAPTPAPAPTLAQPPAAVPVRRADTPSVPAAKPPAPTPAPAAAQPVGVAVNSGAGPVGPGFSLSDVGQPPAAAAAPPSATTTPAPSAAAPLASLAQIVSSIEIPPEELERTSGAVGADTLAKLVEDKRKADAAEAAKREKEEAAAKAKAEADAKAKEEAAKKKANPSRIWVQVAAGSNQKALAFDFNRFAKKNAALFKGKDGGSTEWGRTRRLLVGPFKDKKAAADWLAQYKKAGGDGFVFTSDAGQEVDLFK